MQCFFPVMSNRFIWDFSSTLMITRLLRYKIHVRKIVNWLDNVYFYLYLFFTFTFTFQFTLKTFMTKTWTSKCIRRQVPLQLDNWLTAIFLKKDTIWAFFFSHSQVPLSFCETCSCCVTLSIWLDLMTPDFMNINYKRISISADNRNTFVWHLRERCCFETNAGWIYDWTLLFRLLVPAASWTPPPLFSGVRVQLPVHGPSLTLWGYFRD